MNPPQPIDLSEQSASSLEDHVWVLQQIYANRYFTNHGPLANRFEAELETLLNVGNVIAIGNESLAVLIALAGLELAGDLIVPAIGAQLIADVAPWLNQRIRYCDVDLETHQATEESISRVLDDDVAAVCLVEIGGRRCGPDLIQWLGDQGKSVVILASDSIPRDSGVPRAGNHSQVVRVYEFGPSNLLSTMQGGAIATSDDELAERFRNIRSSYGIRRKVDVVATCNGRFSEYQAGMGLRTLGQLPQRLRMHQRVANVYRERLADVAGLDLSSSEIADRGTRELSGQTMPLRVRSGFRLTRDQLRKQLAKRGHSTSVAKPSTVSLPVADKLGRELLLLPLHPADLANSESAGLHAEAAAAAIADAIASLA